MLSSDMGPKAGISLTEVLVVLAILSLTLAVFATSRPGPSDGLKLQARTSDLVAQASQTRNAAVQTGRQQTLDLEGPFCADSDKALIFFANGTAQEATICLAATDQEIGLYLDPVTGQLALMEGP